MYNPGSGIGMGGGISGYPPAGGGQRRSLFDDSFFDVNIGKIVKEKNNQIILFQSSRGRDRSRERSRERPYGGIGSIGGGGGGSDDYKISSIFDRDDDRRPQGGGGGGYSSIYGGGGDGGSINSIFGSGGGDDKRPDPSSNPYLYPGRQPSLYPDDSGGVDNR